MSKFSRGKLHVPSQTQLKKLSYKSNYQINQDKCKLIDLVEEFRELSLKYEEDNHTKCGFKDASMYQYDIISAIQNRND